MPTSSCSMARRSSRSPSPGSRGLPGVPDGHTVQARHGRASPHQYVTVNACKPLQAPGEVPMSIHALVREQLARMRAAGGATLALLAALPLIPLNQGASDGAVAGRVTDQAGAPVQNAQVAI